ncbi:N-acetylglutamate kinase [Planifilum fulgidum]|uniref:Acetylglutamate kinase n=1 Tax=Planifilum fulgidum TaxID=201973 RepID=A0A1I2S2Z7_9BACL|nr:acetylglutamate kinase [Planifilum fulgidum]SFG47192.1 N-acetylglutamate kinase [Planifilum fulgidum]
MADVPSVVIKIGGSVLERLHPSFYEACVSLNKRGVRVTVVHGGGPVINRLLERSGIRPRFVRGLRVTDAETLSWVQMALAGLVNKDLAARLQGAGASAVGLSGVDGRLIQVRQKDPSLGYVGEVTGVGADLLSSLLEKGWMPVVASLGVDEAGQIYNVNADTAAGAIARALGASRMVMVTDVPGIYASPEKKEGVLRTVTPAVVRGLIQSGKISGGMLPKVSAALSCLKGPVQEVLIVDGEKPISLDGTEEDGWNGTRIVQEEGADHVVSHIPTV